MNSEMTDITSQELTEARNIVHRGLQHAARSLSFFMKEEITLSEMDCAFNRSPDPAEFTSKQGEEIHVLITELMGELRGVCCLIFNNEEADKLRTIALPEEIRRDPEMMNVMSDGILLEIDNIISASVITQFSDIFKRKVYGNVPSIKKLNREGTNQLIKQYLQQNLFIINFSTHFVSNHLDFNPQFIWLFDDSFAKSIRDYTAAINPAKETSNAKN